MKNVEYKYFECSCSSPDHTIRFVYFPEDDTIGTDLYLDVQLNQTYSVFKRIWLAIKYVFGYTKKYGHWDCTIINPEDYDDLLWMIKRARMDHKQHMRKVIKEKYGKATKNK